MAYDEELTDRFRKAVDGLGGIVETRMMGGVCFMLDGNMLGGANRQKTGEGRFMFRVGKDNEAEAMKRPGAMTMEQGGRKMTGLIFVYEDDCDAERLQSWIALALTFVGNLPPK